MEVKMAIGPKDIELNEKEKAEVKKYEDEIDIELRRLYSSEAGVVKVRVGQILDNRIMNELIARYKKVGWSNVQYENYDVFTFTA